MNKVKYHQAAVQIYRYEQGEIPPAQVFVTLANPGGSKADCARATGIDPKTIRKWWK